MKLIGFGAMLVAGSLAAVAPAQMAAPEHKVMHTTRVVTTTHTVRRTNTGWRDHGRHCRTVWVHHHKERRCR